MRLVIVTGRSPHHKNLCVKLARAHEVVGIIHPAANSKNRATGLNKLFSQIRKHGLPLVLLHILKGLPAGGNGAAGADAHPVDLPDFSDAEKEYEKLPRELIHDACDVQSAATRALLKSLKPDVAVCLGGPVYPKAFIDACPLMLNFHSGVSPFYNGTSSIQFAFALGTPQFCGGTLMVINAGVDSGGIIGHFLPAIQPGDTPESLFQKTVAGAPGMYDRVLTSLEEHPRPLNPIPQPRPLFYTRGVEYGWHHKVMTACRRREKLAARFQRAEKAVEYWRAPDAAGALDLYRRTLDALLWEAAPAGRA